MSKAIPPALIEHILPFNWEVCRVWALKAAVDQVPCADFAYLLDLPLWSSVKGRGVLFDLRPRQVMRHPGSSPYQCQRLNDVDLAYPIDVLIYRNRRWILDGVHRIAKHLILKHTTLPARFHDAAVIPAIAVD